MSNGLSLPSDVPEIMARATRRRVALLLCLSAQAGRWVSGDELAQKALGLAQRGHTICGIFGAFGRWLHAHQDWRWPVLARESAGRWEYMVPPHLAAEFMKFA